MHNILIAQNTAYGSGSEGTVNMANLPTLNRGAVVLIADGKEVIAADGSNAKGIKSFQILVGITKNAEYGIGLQNSVPITVSEINYIDFEIYNAPVTQQVEVGPFPLAAGTAEGEIGMTLQNNSYVRTLQTDQLRINEYKKSSQSLASVLQKIVDRINNGTGLPRKAVYKTFVTASLVGTADDNYKIQLTMKSEGIDFAMYSYGLAEGVVIATTRKAVLSKGKGVDVRRAEDEYSGNLGNAGYGWRNELYYSKPLEADAGTNYDIISISFNGMHDTPQNKVRAAVNWLQLAIPTDSQLTETLRTLFATIAPTKYKPSKDQDNQTDGDPAGAAGSDPEPQV